MKKDPYGIRYFEDRRLRHELKHGSPWLRTIFFNLRRFYWRKWIYYIRTGTEKRPGGDFGLLRVLWYSIYDTINPKPEEEMTRTMNMVMNNACKGKTGKIGRVTFYYSGREMI